MKTYMCAAALLLIILTGCAEGDFISLFEKPYVPPEETSAGIEVYFCPADNCESVMITAIENAEHVDCALHDLELPDLTKTLEQKHARVVLDNSYPIETALDIVYDTKSQITHNKFCVLDEHTVITGSMNPTDRGATKNNNNLMIIHSTYLAQNYAEEFQELWNKEFGEGDEVVYPFIYLNNKKVENYFCPEDHCKEHVMSMLNQAQSSIYFLVFSFTDKDIADVLIEKSNTLNVRGVMEKQRITMQHNVFDYLKEQGVAVLPDANPYTLHHKVFIIDNSIVIAGSYNPTKAADTKNDENIVIIHDPAIAEQFLAEFDQIWAAADNNI